MADDNVNVQFGATVDGAVAAIKQLQENIEGVGGTVGELAGLLPGIGEALAAAFGIEKLDQFIEKIGDLGLQVERTSTQLGLSTEEVSLLNYAAETNDVSTSQMRNSLERLGVGLQTAEQGSNRAATAFKQLSGETAQQFLASGGSMNDLIMKISKNTAELNGKVNLAPSYIALMGRSGADAIPVFLDLGKNIDDLKSKVSGAGLTFSPELTDRIAETRKANIDLKEANRGLGVSISSILKPAIDGAVLGFRNFVGWLNQSANDGGVLQGILEGVTYAFMVLEATLIETGHVLNIIGSTAVDLFNAAAIKATSFGLAIYDALHGNITRAKLDIQQGTDEINAMFIRAGVKEAQSDKETTEKLKKMWDDYFKYVANDAHSSADQIAQANKDAAAAGDPNAALKKAQEDMNKDVEAHKAMLAEEVADVGNNLKARMLLQQQYYDWLKAKYPQDANALAEAGKQIAQTQNAEVKEMTQKWDSFFGSFNSGINGMLTGQSNFKQAFAKTMLNLVDLGIKAIEHIVAQWLAGEITKTSATNAGNAARTASDTAAAAAGKTAQAAADSTAVLHNAYTAASGAYSSTAAIPIVGPVLAPAAAAAAFAATIAFASFDVGTPYVPNTGLAMVHQGEAIIPASMNKNGLGGAGSGPDVHFHVNAMDSQSVEHFFNTHGGKIAQTMVDQYRRGNASFRYPR